MKLNNSQVDAWVDSWNSQAIPEGVKIIIAASTLHLNKIKRVNGVRVSAQNVSHFDKGAHTGEVGAFQLKEYIDISPVLNTHVN